LDSASAAQPCRHMTQPHCSAHTHTMPANDTVTSLIIANIYTLINDTNTLINLLTTAVKLSW